MATKLRAIRKRFESRSPLRNAVSSILMLVGCFVILAFFHEDFLIVIGILHGIAGISLLIVSLVGYVRRARPREENGEQSYTEDQHLIRLAEMSQEEKVGAPAE